MFITIFSAKLAFSILISFSKAPLIPAEILALVSGEVKIPGSFQLSPF
jgi:protein involved in polysaccharide export with SLBB domain